MCISVSHGFTQYTQDQIVVCTVGFEGGRGIAKCMHVARLM